MDLILKVGPKTIKPKRKYRGMLNDIGFGNYFLTMTLRTHASQKKKNRKKTNKLDFIKMKNRSSKDTINRVKDDLWNEGKYFVNHI